MKTVVILVYRMGVGGAERLIVEDVHELMRVGYAVRLVTFAPESRHSFLSALPEGCTTEQIPFKGVLDIRALRLLARLLRDTSSDLILTHLWFANTVGRFAAQLAGLSSRVISFEHNVYDTVKTRKQFFIDWLLQGWCAKVVAVSESVKESLIRHGIRESRIVVVPNAVDSARFTQAPPSHIREKLNLADSFLYLYVGRLTKQKGVDVLLDAFAKIPASRGHAALLIAGQGEERAAREIQATALGIAPRVFFLGVRDDIPSLMKTADCFVLASRFEGHPMVGIEAMAAGMPIVITDFPTGLGIFHNRENAIIVPREDSQSLACAMEEIQTDTALRESLAAHAVVDAQSFAIGSHREAILACLTQKP